MAGWLEPEGTTTVRDERYLRVPDPGEVDETCKAVIRFLDEKPKQVWRHWINNRPYNCPGKFQGCPVCKVREVAMARDKEAGRNQYRMDRKWLVNALLTAYIDEANNVEPLEEPEVKIYSFGKEMGEALELYLKEYGDLHTYDVKIVKKKTGTRNFDLRYSLLKGEKYDLTAEHQIIADNTKHDINEETKPALIGDLVNALNGQVPDTDGEPTENASFFVSVDEVTDVKVLAKEKGYNLADFFPGQPEDKYGRDEFNKVKSKLQRL